MARYLTEGIGTFFLVLLASMAYSIGGSLAPFAIGAGIIGLVYMGYHLSGAHYNPAISLAMFINGKLSLKDLGIYVGLQLVAALAAAAIHGLLVYVVDADAAYKLVIEPQSPAYLLEGTLAEILMTFLLVLVLLNADSSPAPTSQLAYGLAYGLVVMAGILTVREISGGSFNPAFTIGPNVIHYAYAPSPEVWLITGVGGPLVGAALAAFIYQLQVPQSEPTTLLAVKEEIELVETEDVLPIPAPPKKGGKGSSDKP